VPDVTNVQLNPPRNWQDFERLCQALWRQIWADPNIQRHGRTGQAHNYQAIHTVLLIRNSSDLSDLKYSNGLASISNCREGSCLWLHDYSFNHEVTPALLDYPTIGAYASPRSVAVVPERHEAGFPKPLQAAAAFQYRYVAAMSFSAKGAPE
jgi:hypothetical protein